MWIEKKPSGKLRLCEHYIDRAGVRRKTGVPLERMTKSGRKAAEEALFLKVRKLAAQVEDISLEELLSPYIAEQRKLMKAATWQRNERVLQKVFAIVGPSQSINTLRVSQIRESLLKTDKPATTLNEYVKRLKALLSWGYRNEYHVNKAIVDKLERFKDTPHKIKIKDKFLEYEELQKVIDAMTLERWKLLTMFLVLSGLRIGEAAALTVTDVDLKNKKILVTKTYSLITQEVTTTKTLCSTREVYMQDELYKVCLKIYALSGPRKRNLFIPGPDGDYLCAATYNKYLKRITEKCAGRKLTAHALRHTHASLLLAQGVSIDTVSRRLGHEDSQVTREIYLHVTEMLKRRDQAQIDACSLFGGPPGDKRGTKISTFFDGASALKQSKTLDFIDF